MANYHKRNSIRAVQWDPENAQSFKDINLHLRVSQILNSNRSVQNDKRKRNGTERF